jgi:hypothetical protein
MVFDFDDPIAKREKREAESILSGPDDNLCLSSIEKTPNESQREVEDILSVLDTVNKEKDKKYKE